jgi:hypothetical protein
MSRFAKDLYYLCGSTGRLWGSSGDGILGPLPSHRLDQIQALDGTSPR